MANDLTDAIVRVLDGQGIANGAFETPIPGLRVVRTHDRVMPMHMNYKPSLCVVAQGAKEVLVGDRTLKYGHMQSLVVTIDAPVLSEIVEAAPDKPFVGAVLNLDPAVILDVVSRLEANAIGAGRSEFGMVVSEMDAQICGSLIRLLETMERPQGVEILSPAIMREIAYWLLTGPAGRNVARMVLPDGQPQKMARAFHHLRLNFDTTVSIAELAAVAGMSPSSFHQHFKAMTSMSPLQYQKHIRLLEARRLMVKDGEKAGAAAFAVGYESVSQFSREYARMFGSPPRRETQRARNGVMAAAGSAAGEMASVH